MDPHKLEPLIHERLRILGIICAALVGSVLFYGVLAWFLLAQGAIGPGEEGGPGPFVPYVLAALGFCALVAAPVVSSAVFRSGGGGKETPDPEQMLARYQTSVIVGFAVRESAAVFGLVATFLTGDLIWVGVLGLAASLAMIAAWPRREKVQSVLRTGPPAIG